MPGWILVANRFSLLPIMRKCGDSLSVMAAIACLVVVSGCSNMRQQSLELPLPILPSENAIATDSNGEASEFPQLTNNKSDKSAADSAGEDSVENASSLDPAVFKNDFDTSEFDQDSAQSFMTNGNDFQPQKPSARFVGVQDNAEMSGIKLTAINKAAPAPPIAKASHESEIDSCETPEVCEANAAGQCDCCKKKELPKLAVMQPLDPEQLPELFGPNRTPAEPKTLAPIQSPLRPMQAASASLQPIRLTARQDSETIPPQKDATIAESAQTQNKAQLLIPIAPAVLQEFKAEVEKAESQEAQAIAKSHTIKVSPLMDINSSLEKNSIAAPARATAANLASANKTNAKTADADQAKFIPISSSGIQVSEVPFQSLPKPVVEPAKPTIKLIPAAAVALAPIAKPEPKSSPIKIAEPVEIAKPKETFKPVDLATNSKQDPPATSNDFSPLLTISARPIEAVVEQEVETQTTPIEVARKTGPILQAPLAAEVVDNGFKEFAVTSPTRDINPLQETNCRRSNPLQETNPVSDINPLSEVEPLDDVEPSANIDPLVDQSGLPDPSQIEEELAEFKKGFLFDPRTVIESERIDPAILLAKLDGPPKTIAAPVPAKVVETSPDNDIINQQLADQRSVLQELQESINQLKVKPVSTSPAVPELTLSNAAFCTKISGFGQFKPFAANNFSGSQKTLLYCEVENQTAKQFTNIDGSQQFETVLHGSIAIYDANDQVVQTAKFPAIKDVARHQRRDFYVYFPVQFDELARGDYRLELSVEDAAANKTAVLRPFMRFSVR